jgi:hypothetical protein
VGVVRSAVDQAAGPAWCGQRRGPTLVGRDRRAGAASVTRDECQRVGRPPVAAQATTLCPSSCSGSSAFPSRVVGRAPHATARRATAMGGERSAIVWRPQRGRGCSAAGVAEDRGPHDLRLASFEK